MSRILATTIGKQSQNPFKGNASLIIRLLFQDPDKHWTGKEIAKKLELSQAWVNRVFCTLETEGIVQRNLKGPHSITQLVEPKKLLERWTHHYRLSQNQLHYYLLLEKFPLKKLATIAEKKQWPYALTGYEAANLIKPVSSGTPPMIYLWSHSKASFPFRTLLARLENQHQFIPVKKEANLIILEPHLKETVFFGCQKNKNITTVSPVQLFLDLYGLDQGKYIINLLADFWKKHKIPYDI